MKQLNPFKPIENAPLIVFRVFFGFLFACETFGALLTGWVKDNFLLPDFTFSHIGMEWLQPLPGYGMVVYFCVMGVLGLLVMSGWYYRISISLLTVLWAGVYFMQKTSYNNHYYLLMLVALMMCFLPANQYASVDAKRNPKLKSLSMPVWCAWVMILQISIVYFYATLAKFYPDWLDGTFTRNLFSTVTDNKTLLEVFGSPWFYLFIAYSGILFDGLIVPALMWKKTRNYALIASLVFHLFNSITLKIGIFPYFALSFALFFYEPNSIRKIFLKRKPEFVSADQSNGFASRRIFYLFFIPFFVIQLALPLRHYFIKGDVLWTEEGHRLSWRMMLRDREGYVDFKVIDKKTKQQLSYPVQYVLTRKQYQSLATKPDMIWQMAQRIKKHFEKEGIEVSVFVDCMVSINGKNHKKLVNPKVDLAASDWNYFGHDEWVLLYN